MLLHLESPQIWDDVYLKIMKFNEYFVCLFMVALGKLLNVSNLIKF